MFSPSYRSLLFTYLDLFAGVVQSHDVLVRVIVGHCASYLFVARLSSAEDQNSALASYKQLAQEDTQDLQQSHDRSIWSKRGALVGKL